MTTFLFSHCIPKRQIDEFATIDERNLPYFHLLGEYVDVVIEDSVSIMQNSESVEQLN